MFNDTMMCCYESNQRPLVTEVTTLLIDQQPMASFKLKKIYSSFFASYDDQAVVSALVVEH